MIERNWDASDVAGELQDTAAAAAQLSIRISRIWLKATPEARLRLDRLDPSRKMDVDEALEAFTKTANRVSEQLLDELEYPHGGSHREPGYRHGDAA